MDDLESALAREAEKKVETRWKPISVLPPKANYGTAYSVPLLLYNDNIRRRCLGSYSYSACLRDRWYAENGMLPTHWLPLPEFISERTKEDSNG